MARNERLIWWAVALTTLVLFAAAHRDLLLGKRIFQRDALIWYGSFHFLLENLLEGVFPYWDPYPLTGTPFYPNISAYGLLDPAMLICAAAARLSDISPLTLFTWFRLYRIALFVSGAYLVFRYFSRNSIAAVIASGVLLLAIMPQNAEQPMMDYSYAVPLAIYFIMRLLDSKDHTGRRLNLLVLILITGIAMNVFIPSAYLFNLAAFTVVIFVVRYRSRLIDMRGLCSLRSAILAAVSGALIIMLSAPPLSVMLMDASPGGELFPSSRLMEAAGYEFKQVMATEVGDAVFSERFTNSNGSFISFGNLMSLLFPDPSSLAPLIRDGYCSAPLLYIGTIPFLFLAIAAAGIRTPYKWLPTVMFLLLFINCFSYYSVRGAFNPLQKAFNLLFPPLKMIDTRLNFASLIVFYLCLLLSMTIGALGVEGPRPGSRPLRYRRGLAVLGAVVALKAAAIILLRDPALTVAPHDWFVFGQVALFGVAMLAYVRWSSLRKPLSGLLLLVGLIDLAVYSSRCSLTPAEDFYRYLGQKDLISQSIMKNTHSVQGEFQYFRQVYDDTSPFQAFAESISGVKGAIPGNAAGMIFTTKRYYDKFALLPLRRLFDLDGVIYPIVRFFPIEKSAEFHDRRELLRFLGAADSKWLGNHLAVEPGELPNSRDTRKARPVTEYESIPWYGTKQLATTYAEAMPYIEELRWRASSFLDSKGHSVKVDSFSPNDIVISLRNDRQGYLLYDDGWSRYWRAFDGDTELPVLAANYNSKAVLLAPGNHRIRFLFDPLHYRYALWSYTGGLLLTAALIVFFAARRRYPAPLKAT